MKYLTILVLLLTIVLELNIGNGAARSEGFWLLTRGGKGGRFLTKIDPLGTIIQPPSKIQDADSVYGKFMALSQNGRNALNVWIGGSDVAVQRLVIDKRTLKTIRIIRTNIKSFGRLSVTKKTINNYIAFLQSTSEGVKLVSYPIDNYGAFAGRHKTLSPPLNCPCSGGLSSDGRTAYYSTIKMEHFAVESLYVQPLGAMGNPNSSPTHVDQAYEIVGVPEGIAGIEASNDVASNTRWFLYHKQYRGDDVPLLNRAFFQPLNLDTSEPSSPKVKVTPPDDGNTEVLMDPLRRFVLTNARIDYTQSVVVYQALDSLGHLSGKPRLILSSGDLTKTYYFEDLLREAS